MTDFTPVEVAEGCDYNVPSVVFESHDQFLFAGRTIPQPTSLHRTPDGALVRWGSPLDPPTVGNKVSIKMNRLGTGTVIGYFREHGWLGVNVLLDAKPKSMRKRKDGRYTVMVFAVELYGWNCNEPK